jgi:hypothetical protein
LNFMTKNTPGMGFIGVRYAAVRLVMSVAPNSITG